MHSRKFFLDGISPFGTFAIDSWALVEGKVMLESGTIKPIGRRSPMSHRLFRYIALTMSFLGLVVALQFAGATERVFKLSPADADKTPQGEKRPIKQFKVAQVIIPRQ